MDDDEADTLEYSYKNTYIYNPAKNGAGLTGEEIITLMHPVILGMGLGISVDRPELLPFISNVIRDLFGAPSDAFWTGRVMDLLFDGIPIDCSSEGFEAAAACGEFSSGEHKAIQPQNETFYKFSLFGGVSDWLRPPYLEFHWRENSFFFRSTERTWDALLCCAARRIFAIWAEW